MNYALIFAIFLLTCSRPLKAMDLRRGEVITLKVEGPPVIWTGDGFSLACKPSKMCQVQTSDLGAGTFRIIYSTSQPEKMQFGEISLTVLEPNAQEFQSQDQITSINKTKEVTLSFSNEFQGKTPFVTPLKNFAILRSGPKTIKLKDFPSDLKIGDKINSPSDSIVFTKLTEGEASILFGEAGVEIIEDTLSIGTPFYSWTNGTVLFNLKKEKKIKVYDYEISLESSTDEKPINDPMVLVSSFKQGFVVVPIKGTYKVSSTKTTYARLSPSFALGIQGQSTTFLSLTSCDDPVPYIKEKVAAPSICSRLSLEYDLLFDPRLLQVESFKTDSPHLETISQSWLRDFFARSLNLDEKFSFQILGDKIPESRFDLKLRSFLKKNQCQEILKFAPATPSESNLKSYFEGLCHQRDQEVGLAANRWSWLVQKKITDDAYLNSNYSLNQLDLSLRKKGYYSLYAGLDTNPTLKGKDVEASPYYSFDVKKFYIVGGSIHREDVLSSESSLKFFFQTDIDAAFYIAKFILGMSDLVAQFSVPARFRTHRNEEVELKPKVIAKGKGTFIENIGIGAELSYKRNVLGSSMGFITYEDFNNSIETFDPLSGNVLSLKKSSDRPYREFYLGISYDVKLAKGDLELFLRNRSAKYRFDVSENQSFAAWQLGSKVKYFALPLVRIEGEANLELRAYKSGFSGTNLRANLSSIWDFHPDHSVFAKIEHQSARSPLRFGQWSNNIYIIGLRREFR